MREWSCFTHSPFLDPGLNTKGFSTDADESPLLRRFSLPYRMTSIDVALYLTLKVTEADFRLEEKTLPEELFTLTDAVAT